MSARTLDTVGGVNGGAIKLCHDPKRARNIHVTVTNIDVAASHCAFFGRSRRELEPIGGGTLQGGFALPVPAAVVPAAGNGVQFAPGQGEFSEVNIGGTGGPAVVAVSSFVLQGWAGELWACADTTGKVVVDVFDAAFIEI